MSRKSYDQILYFRIPLKQGLRLYYVYNLHYKDYVFSYSIKTRIKTKSAQILPTDIWVFSYSIKTRIKTSGRLSPYLRPHGIFVFH